MGKLSVEETVSDLTAKAIAEYGYELVDVEYVKAGKDWILRIFIDKPSGVTLDDCQIASETISSELDKQNIIEKSYLLEVSSPGERPLKRDADFIRYKGEWVELKLYEAINGNKLFQGKLIGLENSEIKIEDESGNQMNFERMKVAVVKRIIRL